MGGGKYPLNRRRYHYDAGTDNFIELRVLLADLVEQVCNRVHLIEEFWKEALLECEAHSHPKAIPLL